MRDKLQLYFDDDISDRDKLLDTFEYRTVRIGDKRSLGINKLLELYLEMYKSKLEPLNNKKLPLDKSNKSTNIIITPDKNISEYKIEESKNMMYKKFELLEPENIQRILNTVYLEGNDQIIKNINTFSRSLLNTDNNVFQYAVGVFGELNMSSGYCFNNIATMEEIENFLKTKYSDEDEIDYLKKSLFKLGNILFRLPMNPSTDIDNDDILNNLTDDQKKIIKIGMGYKIDNRKYKNNTFNDEYGLLVNKNQGIVLPKIGNTIANKETYIPIMGITKNVKSFIKMLRNSLGSNEIKIDELYNENTNLKGYIIRNFDYSNCLNNDDESFNSINVSGRIVGYIMELKKMNKQEIDMILMRIIIVIMIIIIVIMRIIINNNSNNENNGEIIKINLNGMKYYGSYLDLNNTYILKK